MAPENRLVDFCKKGIKAMISVLSLKSAIERSGEFDAVLSIENADGNYVSLSIIDGRPHLTLAFNDIDIVGEPWADLIIRLEQLEAAREFYWRQFKDYEKEGEGQFLVHCHAGRCRSPAVALFLLADEMGAGREDEAVQRLFQVSERPAPNLLVLDLADKILKRDGRLIDAWMPFETDPVVQRLRSIKRTYLEAKHTTEDNRS